MLKIQKIENVRGESMVMFGPEGSPILCLEGVSPLVADYVCSRLAEMIMEAAIKENSQQFNILGTMKGVSVRKN